MKRIAVVEDETKLWTVWVPILQKKGIDVKTINIYRKEDHAEIIEGEWDGVIWRAKHDPHIRNLAKRILYFLNAERNINTFPSWKDYWHYDDKIAQYYLMKELGIRTAETTVLYDKNDALIFVDEADYPMIFKATSGAGSSNVGLLKSKSAARRYVKKAFDRGIKTYFREDIQYKYVYFQEFLKNNKGDYKIVCFGSDRITGFFRKNRENDIFASGGARLHKEPIPHDLLEFVGSVHQKIGAPVVMSYDILKNNQNEWVVTELGVIFGDLSVWDWYTNSFIYELNNNNKIIELNNVDYSNDEYFIDLLLNEWKLDD
jgi:glutathione synthase/RimK-type ligase-like ATP-grasp enzyme